MSVTRYEPWLLMNRLSRDLDRLINAPIEAGADSRSPVVDWLPAVDIKEDDKQFVLRADLPGVDPKGIEITMEEAVLTLCGRREAESRDEKNGYRRVERVGGEFFRQAIKARHVNGVLEVMIPKQDAVLPRKISVATH